jgi:hypothetical protein
MHGMTLTARRCGHLSPFTFHPLALRPAGAVHLSPFTFTHRPPPPQNRHHHSLRLCDPARARTVVRVLWVPPVRAQPGGWGPPPARSAASTDGPYGSRPQRGASMSFRCLPRDSTLRPHG